MADKFVFEFDVEQEDGDTITIIKSFNVVATNKNLERIKKEIDQGQYSDFIDILDNLEGEYGVHDVSFSLGAEFLGLCTYEVKADMIDELMGKWKKFFEDQEFVIGEISSHIVSDDD